MMPRLKAPPSGFVSLHEASARAIKTWGGSGKERLATEVRAGRLLAFELDAAGKARPIEVSAWKSTTSLNDNLISMNYRELIFRDADIAAILPNSEQRLAKVVAEVGGATPATQSPNASAANPRGRKNNPEADRFWIEICRIIADGSIEGGQEGLTSQMAQWSSDNMRKAYDADTVRKKIGELFKALNWGV